MRLGLVPCLAFSSTGYFNENSTSYAAFGQLTWNISDDWRSSVGLRYSDESKNASRWMFNRVYQSGNRSPRPIPCSTRCWETLI